MNAERADCTGLRVHDRVTLSRAESRQGTVLAVRTIANERNPNEPSRQDRGGACSGIGRATAMRLGQEGTNLILNDVYQHTLSEIFDQGLQ